MNEWLKRAGWGDATHHALAGDASARRYTRLDLGAETAILMQDPDGDVGLFAHLADHLNTIGLSAPKILAKDIAKGLLLIEDFGDGLIARLCDKGTEETPLYLTAIDALVHLHKHPAPEGLPIATPEVLTNMTGLVFDAYAMRASTSRDASTEARALQQMHEALDAFGQPQGVMMLRDYHAENILLLADRDGPARAGLLDFQDAMISHRAYDVVSLLRDARRDVSATTSAVSIRHYLDQTGLDETPFRTSLAVLGVQRNLRILGVFTRLAARGKPHYIDLIPRVWAHLQADLAAQPLAKLQNTLEAILPKPTPALLDELRTPCPTL